jgi:hypothetical protein
VREAAWEVAPRGLQIPPRRVSTHERVHGRWLRCREYALGDNPAYCLHLDGFRIEVAASKDARI